MKNLLLVSGFGISIHGPLCGIFYVFEDIDEAEKARDFLRGDDSGRAWIVADWQYTGGKWLEEMPKELRKYVNVSADEFIKRYMETKNAKKVE